MQMPVMQSSFCASHKRERADGSGQRQPLSGRTHLDMPVGLDDGHASGLAPRVLGLGHGDERRAVPQSDGRCVVRESLFELTGKDLRPDRPADRVADRGTDAVDGCEQRGRPESATARQRGARSQRTEVSCEKDGGVLVAALRLDQGLRRVREQAAAAGAVVRRGLSPESRERGDVRNTEQNLTADDAVVRAGTATVADQKAERDDEECNAGEDQRLEAAQVEADEEARKGSRDDRRERVHCARNGSTRPGTDRERAGQGIDALEVMRVALSTLSLAANWSTL